MRDQDALHRKLGDRAKRHGELRVARLAGEPGLRAHAHASVAVTQEDVTGNERGVPRYPVDDLGGPCRAERLDPSGK